MSINKVFMSCPGKVICTMLASYFSAFTVTMGILVTSQWFCFVCGGYCNGNKWRKLLFVFQCEAHACYKFFT